MNAIEFASFRIDRSSGGIVRLDGTGTATPISIGSRALDVLCVLANKSGELVSKRELMDAVWPGVTVEEKNLTIQVSALRQMLDREGGEGGWIQTAPGRGYRFVAPAPAQESAQESAPAAADDPSRRIRPAVLIAGMAVALLFASLVGGVWLAGSTAASLDGPKPLIPYSPQDRRQSMIVMPFENSSGDPAQDGLPDGLARDIADVIAEDPTIPIIPSMTAYALRGTRPDLREIGRTYDVHFALTGSARRENDRLLVSVTLFETASARPVWARRFDMADTGNGKSMIMRAVQTNVDRATQDNEAALALQEHPGRLDKRDLMFIATSSAQSELTEASNAKSLTLIERALAIDPNYLWALRENAIKHAQRVLNGFSLDPAADLAIATRSVDRGLALSSDEFWILRAKAMVLRAQGNWTEAAALYRYLIERRPLFGTRYFELGMCLLALGQHAEALVNFQTSRSLMFGTDLVNLTDAQIALTLLALGKFSAAADQARFAAQTFSSENGRLADFPWLALIAAEWQAGQMDQAHRDLDRFLARQHSFGTLKSVRSNAGFAANPHLLAGLAGAGLAEE